ncbi:MlaD family protein [Nocardia arthritidis]|uniref:MCE family protein n=1 Tax=Nocardia arthritidis TaxID=228602 RepID=A0A6G9YHE3_9NOCA|nr:MlaD family protein [Nocardia arthritidis]QIS12618.1 MCE family protein [Nocardia arthritidis]
MKSARATVGFGLFAVVAVVLTYTIWSTLQRPVAGGTRSYSAVFSDVLGLRVGDDVRMAGVRVGRVDTIGFGDGYQARVGFRIQDGQHLTSTTKAVVRYQNLIGQRYIALLPGADPGTPLPPDGEIPLARTEPSFDVSALLSGFEPLFDVLRPDQVNSLSETLIQALQGNQVSLGALVTQAAELAGTFGQRDKILGEVLTNLSGVISGLARRSGEFETLLTQARALVEALYSQGESLKSSVDRVAGSTDSLTRLITQLEPGLARAQGDATSGVALLLLNGASLDRAAVELPTILNGIARFTSYGAYGNAYICRLDVSLWGVLLPPGLFSQVGGDSQSEVCR